jgi:YidC/Oxa1 family membrane protein insertase
VLLYWFTTNVWSMGQQFYVIRRMPAPGSPAERALQERRRKRGRAPLEVATDEEATPVPSSGQRVQPKRQARSKRAKVTDVPSTASDAVDGEPTGPSLVKEAPSEASSSEPTASGPAGKAGRPSAGTASPGKTAGKKTAAGKKAGSATGSGSAKKRTKPAPGGTKRGQRPR